MGRRKKQSIEEPSAQRGNFSGDIKRSVVAIFLFMFAALCLLGFFQNGGAIGQGFNLLAGRAFGWGKWLSPLVLIAAGVILLFRKETLFYVSKLLGLFFAFLGLLGFFHLFFEPLEAAKLAKLGSGGGYLGWGVTRLLTTLAGKIGAGVILAGLFLIGLVVAFDFSLVKLLRKFWREKIEDEQEQDAAEELPNLKQEPLENPLVEKKNKKERVEFVHGPDESEDDKHPVSADILKKALTWNGKKSKREKTGSIAPDEWELPSTRLLERSAGKPEAGDVEAKKQKIQETLRHFGIEVEAGAVQVGPTITQYTFRPAVGVKLSKITELNSNLALALEAHPIRIEAPIPGKSLVGIEVPNKKPAIIRLPELFEMELFENRKTNLLLALGKDVNGDPILADLKKMPHLLVAGQTGSGKSVCINSILVSLLYQNSPEDLKMILVDPKRVELSLYDGIPHLITNVITEKSKVVNVLKWAIAQMEERYKLLQKTGSRDIGSCNQKAENGETIEIIDDETGEVRTEKIEKLPFIVIVIDELADLMVSHGKEVETAIIRLAQMARAVGIHLIVSTQRPDVSVITGLIKSNIPTRIAFKVASLIDSRTILDASGAEKLLGNGDMLFSSVAGGIKRLQGALLTEDEVKRVVDFIKIQGRQRTSEIGEDITVGQENEDENPIKTSTPIKQRYEQVDFDNLQFADEESGKDDELVERVKQAIMESQKASTSFVQRKFNLGYNRAARIMDKLEEQGFVGPANGSKQREILGLGDADTTYEDNLDDQQKRDKWQI